ncbi:MAG TPA: glycosyltransferase, partial [Flavobacterium sp.]|nr:glycosyltransferase [Flavobacterium sp.]
MVVIVHNSGRVVAVEGCDGIGANVTLLSAVREATRKARGTIVWCHESLWPYFDRDRTEELLHHQAMLISYDAGGVFLPDALGYVEGASFVSFPRDVPFPTWRMSSNIGAVHSETMEQLLAIGAEVRSFDEFLATTCKIAQVNGLICLSEPRLLTRHDVKIPPRGTYHDLFRFVSRHHGHYWSSFLLLCLLFFERRLVFFAFLSGLRVPKHSGACERFTTRQSSTRQVVREGTVDVVIPTIGRSAYLYDVLKDLAAQDYHPKNVILVEQNPEPGSTSALGYIHTEKWPFGIHHTFLHQAGACNARNIALEQVSSEWIFFADDDIRLPPDTLSGALNSARQYGADGIMLNCLSVGAQNVFDSVHQTSIFGTNCSFIKRQDPMPRFDMALEFGYGEDTDYGMQLRYRGVDILYVPYPVLTHLNAPIGGFRTRFRHPWEGDAIQPKPSPTIMLVKRRHSSPEQVRGYKLVLFFKSLRTLPMREKVYLLF